MTSQGGHPHKARTHFLPSPQHVHRCVMSVVHILQMFVYLTQQNTRSLFHISVCASTIQGVQHITCVRTYDDVVHTLRAVGHR